MGATRHRFRSIVLIFPLVLLPAYARADGFSATASVLTCELIPPSYQIMPTLCTSAGGTLPLSMSAQASNTLASSNGRATISGNAGVNGPSLTATASIPIGGNGVGAGVNEYQASADAEWNDTLTLSAGGTPALAHLGISLSPTVSPALSLASNFPGESSGFAEVNYVMSLVVSDPSLALGMDPGGGGISCSAGLFFMGGQVQNRSTACLPFNGFVLNGLPYSLHMILNASALSSASDQIAQASDPFTLSLTPLESGVQVHSASGVSYTVVPEPAAGLLVMAGVLGLAMSRRRTA